MRRHFTRRNVLAATAVLAIPGAAERVHEEYHARRVSAALEERPEKPAFLRAASRSLATLLTNRVHLLVLGPTGVGKTRALQEVSRASTRSALLPFYVDLSLFIQQAVGQSAEELRSRTLDAFAAEARAYDLRLLRLLERDARSALWLALARALPGWLSSQSLEELRSFTLLSQESLPSLAGLLSRLERAATLRSTLHALSSAALGTTPLVPVLIIDEVHLLQEPALAEVKAELLDFMHRHVQAKERASVVIVLLSSDARAQDIVRKWGRFGRRLRALRLGDLQDREVPSFLEFLAASLPPEAQPAFRAEFESPEARAALRGRFGGYVSDLVALRDAHEEHALGGAAQTSLVVKDTSACAELAQAPELALALLAEVDRHQLLTVFEAILREGVSPRGAVPLEALHRKGVPTAAVHALRAANLVELRENGSVGGEEYAELAPLQEVPYVCAPCPLARESMASVTAQLRRPAESIRS